MFFKLITLFLVFNLINGFRENNRHHQCKNIKQLLHENKQKVRIELFYECLCPFSMDFHTTQLNGTVAELATNLDVATYPYGNAKTHVDKNGAVTFTCQHGEKECYGNMLHACAIYILGQVQAITYNSCLMSYSQSDGGSDDSAADKCGQLFNVDSKSIKACAKGDQGIKLMKIIGDVSNKKYPHSGVPYVLLNGKRFHTDKDFKEAVCKALKNSPKAC